MTSLVLADGASVRSVALSDLPETAWRYLLGSSSGDNASPAAYHAAVPWLYRAVSLRAQALADLPHAVMRGEREIEPPPWLASLHGLLYSLEVDLCLYGAGYWMVERNRVRVLTLRRLQPQTITPVYDEASGLVGFDRTLGKQKLRLDLADVVWWWLPNHRAEIGPGVPPAAVAMQAAGLIANADEFASMFFKRGAIPAVLLSVEGSPAQSELERLEAWWKRLLTGVRHAWETVAVRATVKPQVIGAPMKDLSLVELTVSRRLDICVALGIPITLLNAAAANYATAQQDDLNFYSKTIVPEATLVQERLNVGLFERLGLHFEFRPQELEAFQRLESEKADKLVSLLRAGVLTVNEVRDQLGYTPLAETSSEPQERPLDDVESAERRRWERKAQKALASGKSPAVPFVSDVLAPTEQRAVTAALAMATTPADIRATFSASAASASKRSQSQPADGALDERDQLERRHAGVLAAALRAQLDAVVSPDMTEQDAPAAVDRLGDAVRPLRDALYSMLSGAVAFGVERGRDQVERRLGTAKDIDLSFDWTLVNVDAQAWASRYAGELLAGITETTRAALRQAIAEWAGNGLPLSHLIHELTEPNGPFSRQRAVLIATTEVTRAYAEGNVRAWRASGVINRREWQTAFDERVCPTCGPLSGAVRDLSEPFDGVTNPPAHPRCRCWVLPVEGQS